MWVSNPHEPGEFMPACPSSLMPPCLERLGRFRSCHARTGPTTTLIAAMNHSSEVLVEFVRRQQEQ
jgi:hypothetical protein